jgi:hypothetical protein
VLGTGIPAPPGTPQPQQPLGTAYLAGTVPIQSVSGMQASLEKQHQDQQQQPIIQGLAGHIKSAFDVASAAKQVVEQQMLDALYARRGEYTPEKRSQIEAAGQPLIYMMLPSVKMRQAEALLRDVLIGSGAEKPWTIEPTPSPELPVEEVQQIFMAVTSEVEQAIMSGLEPTPEDIRQRLMAAKTELNERMYEQAVQHAERMEDKMEDQLIEGGFSDAFDQFITDLTTYKTAFIAGPIIRNKNKLTWGQDGQPVVTKEFKLEWERVDPFDMYPAAWARTIDEGPLIRKHRFTRDKLVALIGVEGYSEVAIRKVLEEYGTSGLSDWLSVETQKAVAEGRLMSYATRDNSLIDALQYWGSVSGKMLIDWGMTEEQVPDQAKEYEVEAWSIGSHVIKATLNPDPLGRRPFYCTSYERIPGQIWGNSVYDLMRDCADMCNATARALASNMAISSGPQVNLNTDRLAPGADPTSMFPWKIWSTTSDPMSSSSQKAIEFFQPNSNAQELMGVFEKFSMLADDYTGIPRYTVGAESTGGAGRTASGMSMMLGNASKIIKSVVGGVDQRIFSPMLERLYYYNMRYGDDPDLKGDICIVARGAMSLTTKDTAQVRRAEFLTLVMSSPIATQIIGVEGIAELLRAAAGELDMNPSKIVPPVPVLKDRMRAAALMSMTGQAPGQEGQEGADGGGTPPQGGGPAPSGQALLGPGGSAGAPVTDNRSPTPKPKGGSK